jgi:hypothetical protein
VTEVFLNLTEVFLTLTEVFPCFFLSSKANARVKLSKTWHGPHSYTLVCICVDWLLFVLFGCYLCCSMYCLCKCVLLPSDNPTTVNKYIVYNIKTINVRNSWCSVEIRIKNVPINSLCFVSV